MDHFAIAWQRTYTAERGYSNNPQDPGGETNHGITIAVARRHGYVGPMRDLTSAEARNIAREGYWAPLRLDAIARIAPHVAYELFDTNFNLWWPAAGLFLQRALNAMNRGGTLWPDLREDGDVGAATLRALEAMVAKRGPQGVEVLLRCLNAQQCSDYMRQCRENPAKETFFFGWVLNRVVV